MILLVIPAVWLALLVVLVALCLAARRGDMGALDAFGDVAEQPARVERLAAERLATGAALESRRALRAEPAALVGARHAA
jgi:hypothetical protein